MDSAQIVVELGEGFVDDEVTITIDRAPVWRGEHIHTDYSIGRACMVNLAAPASSRSLGFEVGPPPRIRRASVDLGPGAAHRFRCAMEPDGSLVITPADDGPVF